MHFIKLTQIDNDKVVINAEKIVGIYNLKVSRRIIFCFDIGGEEVYFDVLETVDEIIAKCPKQKEY